MTAADDATLSNGDLKEFCALVCNGLNPPATGSRVAPEMVVDLHSDDLSEDGTTRVRLFNLRDGRTGIERADGSIVYAD